jgi:hypothetical protein
MSNGNALLGLIPTVVALGILAYTFDTFLGAKEKQKELKKKGVKTKIVKARGKYKLKEVV